MPKCEDCGREFATYTALAQHQKDKHGVEMQPASSPSQKRESESKGRPRSLRKRNRHPVAIGILVAAVVVGVGLYLLVAPSFAGTPVPCSTGDSWIHVHPYISIRIESTSVAVPAYIGYLPGGSQTPTCLEEMHSHDASGIIHIELAKSDANSNYTLSDLFRVWNATYPTVTINGTSHRVVFTNTDIFGFRTDATHRVVVLVDGKAVADGTKVPLEQLDYCDSTNSGVPPCSPTASGLPLWNGGTNYPYKTGHTIVIEYVTS